MKIDPVEFNETLRLIMPAVDSKGIVPILGYICFGASEEYGSYALGYNDSIGIIIFDEELFEDLECAVPGDTLYRTLATFSSEVQLEEAEDSVIVRQGKTELELSILDSGSYLFAPPDEEGEMEYSMSDVDASFEVTSDFIEAISFLVTLAGEDVLYDNQMGITIKSVPGNDEVILFSTDNKSITRVVLQKHPSDDIEINLPLVFCRQLIVLFNAYEEASLQVGVNNDYSAFAQIEVDGDLQAVLFSKLSLQVDYEGFNEVVTENLTKKAHSTKTPLGLYDGLRRAAIIASRTSSDARIEVKYDGYFLKLSAEGESGRIVDEIPFKVKEGNPNFHISANLWMRALAFEPNKMALLDSAVYLQKTDGPFVVDHLIATTQG